MLCYSVNPVTQSQKFMHLSIRYCVRSSSGSRYGINVLCQQLEHKLVCFMRWPQDVWLWRLISSGLTAPVLILSPHTFQHSLPPPPPTLISPHSLSPNETHCLFLWHSFILLPSDSVCTALRLRAASLTHWDNVYLFIFTGQPSPHHCQRRLTRCRPLCKYLFSSVQYISLSFTLPLCQCMNMFVCLRVCVCVWMKRPPPGSNMLFAMWTDIHFPIDTARLKGLCILQLRMCSDRVWFQERNAPLV